MVRVLNLQVAESGVRVNYIYKIYLHSFPFFLLPSSSESCFLDWNHSPQRLIRLWETVTVWVYSSLTANHITPCHIWAHATASHMLFLKTIFCNTWICSYDVFKGRFKHVLHTWHLIDKNDAIHHLVFLKLSAHFLMTVILHHTTSHVVCDADYILMLNSVMEYNHDSL